MLLVPSRFRTAVSSLETVYTVCAIRHDEDADVADRRQAQHLERGCCEHLKRGCCEFARAATNLARHMHTTPQPTLPQRPPCHRCAHTTDPYEQQLLAAVHQPLTTLPLPGLLP